MKSFIILILALFFTSAFYGQRLFGTVTNAKTDAPIAGVNVFIKSIKKGVTSKNNGIFYFEQAHGLKKQDTILFNMVGYQTLEVTLEQYETLDKKVKLVEERFVRNRSSESTGRVITLGKSDNSIK